MPSLRARLASAAVAWKFSDRKHASERGILESIRDTWRVETAPEVVPTSAEDQFTGSMQSWQVFHVRPKKEAVQTQKVVVYFHGGAFIRRVVLVSAHAELQLIRAECSRCKTATGWIFIQKLADELKCDVVVPIYTLAPLSTGTACIQTCIELLAHLERDDIRYRGKQIVLCGDSAGGWIALRVLLALMERQAGKTTFRDRKEHVHIHELKPKQVQDIDYTAILHTISDVLMISPVVDSTADRPEDIEAEKRDPWLSKNIVDTAGRLWSYGPAQAYPAHDFDLPEGRAALPIAQDPDHLPDLDEPAFSPVNGLDIFAECPDVVDRVRVTTFIGTNDILYPQNMRMQARLEALGVKSEMHVYDGLFHVFPLLPWLPESMDAFEKIRLLF